MPFYTFKCPKCEDVKEVLQGMDDSLPTCKECSTILPRNYVKMERVFGATGKPQFKGSGFYETDYKPKIGGTYSSPEEALKAHEKAKGKSK